MKLQKIFILFLSFTILSSCVEDDDNVLLAQDLLLGKWQTISYTENGIAPTNQNTCDLYKTMEYNDSKIFIENFKEDENNPKNCVLEDTISYNYKVLGNVIKTSDFDLEIIDLTTDLLQLKSVVDHGNITKIELYKRID